MKYIWELKSSPSISASTVRESRLIFPKSRVRVFHFVVPVFKGAKEGMNAMDVYRKHGLEIAYRVRIDDDAVYLASEILRGYLLISWRGFFCCDFFCVCVCVCGVFQAFRVIW